MIAESWRRNWATDHSLSAARGAKDHLTPPMPLKVCICSCAKCSRIEDTFRAHEAATKLIYLALRNITKSWTNPPLTWRMAANQFAIQFGQRFNK